MTYSIVAHIQLAKSQDEGFAVSTLTYIKNALDVDELQFTLAERHLLVALAKYRKEVRDSYVDKTSLGYLREWSTFQTIQMVSEQVLMELERRADNEDNS